jgi:hypothetical protein
MDPNPNTSGWGLDSLDKTDSFKKALWSLKGIHQRPPEASGETFKAFTVLLDHHASHLRL